MHNQGSGDAKFRQCCRHQVDEVRRKNAEDLRVRTRGIRQRPQEVEYCPRADLFSRWTRVARGGVSGRGEKKANAQFANGAPGFTQWQIDANTQSFQNVGGATL